MLVFIKIMVITKTDIPENPPAHPGTPKQENVPGEGYAAGPSEAIKAKIAWIEERIKHLNEIMSLVIVVLLVGFFTLGFALATILIQWWTFNANIQKDYKTAIEQQTKNINELNNNLNKILDKIK